MTTCKDCKFIRYDSDRYSWCQQTGENIVQYEQFYNDGLCLNFRFNFYPKGTKTMICKEIINKIREVEADGTREVIKVLVDRKTKEQIEQELLAVPRTYGFDYHPYLIGVPIEKSPSLCGYNVLWMDREKHKQPITLTEALFESKQKELDETKEELRRQRVSYDKLDQKNRELKNEFNIMHDKYDTEKSWNAEYMKRIAELKVKNNEQTKVSNPLDLHRLQNAWNSAISEEIKQLKHMILELGNKVYRNTCSNELFRR